MVSLTPLIGTSLKVADMLVIAQALIGNKPSLELVGCLPREN